MRGSPRRQRVREIRADHVEAAVREVDDAQDAEDQRQAARDEEQQQPVLQGVEALDQKDGKVHSQASGQKGDAANPRPLATASGP